MCDLLQELISGRMAEGVVDELEAVDIEVQHGERRLVRTTPRDHDIESFLEAIAVREIRQAVVIRDVTQLAFRPTP